MWRGPHGDGRSDESDVPTHWSATENVAWRVDVPGWGHSSPVVWGDRVFVTSYVPDGNRRVLLCINRADGKTRWERTVLAAAPEQKHQLNSYASATPATDGRHV
jgi:outer membrane protein assembly factor BamB